MANTSPYTLARRLEADLGSILAPVDISGMPLFVQQLVRDIKHSTTDARLDVRDYELAETRASQQHLAVESRTRLGAIRQHIVVASQYNIFSAIEVAHLSAQIDSIIELVT